MTEGQPGGPLALPGELGKTFEPLRLLGKGAFATVLAVRDRALDREVALKLLHRDDLESRRRFLREAEVMAELNSPHVVRVFDSGNSCGTPYLVMELIEGLILDPNDPPGDPRSLLADVAEGLAQVHAAGLVHRDVKPQNIMVARDGRAVLLDLGLVRGRTDRTRLTRDGMVIGSLRYLCPEGMRGERATPAADWYALGTLAYELLERRPPYRDDQVLARMEGEDPSPVEFHRLDPRGAEARLLRALLHTDPARRRVPAELYHSVLGREVPETLAGPEPSAAVARAGAVAPDSTQAHQAHRAPRGSRVGVVVGLLGLGLLGAVGASWVRRAGASAPAPEPVAFEAGSEELTRVRDAIERMLEGHRGQDGELHEALRGEGYDKHLVEVSREYVDPRLPVRWRRLSEHLVALERALGTTPAGRQKIEEIFLQEVLPALLHLQRDQGMLTIVRMGSSMPGAVLPENLGHLSAGDTASIRTRMDEVGAQAATLASTLEFLRVPRTAQLVAARAELLSHDPRTDHVQLLEELRTHARAPATPDAARSALWQAALGGLPSGFKMTTAPCELRLQVIEEASAWFLSGAGASPRDQATGAARAAHAWFGTMGDCSRGDPDAILPLLERLVTGIEATWHHAPAAVVQQLRWTLMVESGLMLYGYHSTATDPASERIWEVLLQAAEADDPEFSRRERARRAR